MDAEKKLETESYKGVRDFYPEDMAVQRFIFDSWSKTAESFGYERYDASVLEPADLYRSKTSEEIVNEQTYTFTDRGDREVTLRPEMTPTVARMVAGRRRDLSFPIRWYSIPNLFRYERPQRGRLREHWQLNCDLFGVEDSSADVEIITLAHQMLLDFGADASMFEIKVNNRKFWNAILESFEIAPEDKASVTRLVDRKNKMSADEFRVEAEKIAGLAEVFEEFTALLGENGLTTISSALKETEGYKELNITLKALEELGIKNAHFDLSIMRGFDYYTGTVFEIFDVSNENNRSLLGGGRYDNLTALFGGDAITGIGFGMGDVTMRDFLETHGLLTVNPTAPTLMIVPTEPAFNIEGEKIAGIFRAQGIKVAVDLSSKKLGKKLGGASERGVQYVLVVGEDELKNGSFTLKELATGTETEGSAFELTSHIND